jgi:hypothetical protein
LDWVAGANIHAVPWRSHGIWVCKKDSGQKARLYSGRLWCCRWRGAEETEWIELPFIQWAAGLVIDLFVVLLEAIIIIASSSIIIIFSFFILFFIVVIIVSPLDPVSRCHIKNIVIGTQRNFMSTVV